MALSPDDLEQIRGIIRTELIQQRSAHPWYQPFVRGGLTLICVFFAVLALHIAVIGGFTVWHLVHPSN